ncbi:ankyrin repeat domain-containing protein 54 [Scaptodrosophila lebanonensis]|uniref:Ankyrin repeat domain-containing protein 54 n=1 Tax=Drosophila lebanonensis TaxID=7225 RepID=A0A6J2TDB6_DROLE|nr:ankyrin repeat domain-containing protein 54 [Scaptodrosophila lebanonensis]
MAAAANNNSSGLDAHTNNKSNDNSSSGCSSSYNGNGSGCGSDTATAGGIMITPPPVMPPTPTSSPNTHGEWPNLNPNAFQLNNTGEHFALPHLPPLPMNTEYAPSLVHPSTLPSCSKSFKIRPGSIKHRMKMRSILFESNGRKLRTAASTCNIELLNRILEDGGDPNAADEYKRSPLHLAACRGYIPIVQQLLKYGANPNVVDSLGNTPLHLAVISASSNNFNVVVRVLLQGGASVHMYDRSGKSPLELAENKLRLLRNRYGQPQPTPEMAKVLEDMCMLTTLILRYMVKQQRELEDLSTLEKRLQNLSTSDYQEEVVSQTADELLASVERLSINNK